MKGAIKKALGAGCEGLGVGKALSLLRPGRFAVLMFHRIADEPALRASANKPLMVEEGVFARLAETLASECLCLPLAEAVRAARDGRRDSKPMVALTFDDGYADCYAKAFPVLRRFGLPATVYLSTGHLDDPGRMFWWDAAEASLTPPVRHGELGRSGLPGEFLEEFLNVALSPTARRVEDFIRGPMYRLDPAQRETFVKAVGAGRFQRPAMLTWDQVREMAASGLVEFGAHTVSHPLLDQLGFDQALDEVLASKERIEDETGIQVSSFAYPAGRVPAFYGELLDRAGMSHAMTTRPGLNDAAGDPLLIRRMDARLGLAGDEFVPSYFMALCRGCLGWLH